MIPAYNKQHSIKYRVESIFELFESRKITFEIVIVNDGSTDLTISELKRLKDKYGYKVKVYNREINIGKGATIKEGVNHCIHDYVLITDADDDISIFSIEKLVDKFLSIEDIKVMVGDKYHPESDLRISSVRKILSQGFIMYSKLVLHMPFNDTQTGLKLFETKLLKRILQGTKINGFSVDTEILYLVAKEKLHFIKVPVIIKRTLPTTISIKSAIVAVIDIIRIKIYHY